jgi:hypothetical protein
MTATKIVWRRSSFCNGASTCVEFAALPDGGVAMRDSKDPEGPVLTFTADEWAAFTAGVRGGEFDCATLGAVDRPGGDAPGSRPASTLSAP